MKLPTLQFLNYHTDDGREGKVAYIIVPIDDGRVQVVFSKSSCISRRPIGTITGLAEIIVRKIAEIHGFNPEDSIVAELQTHTSNPGTCPAGSYQFMRIRPDWKSHRVRIVEPIQARDEKPVTELFALCINPLEHQESSSNPKLEYFFRDYLALQQA